MERSGELTTGTVYRRVPNDNGHWIHAKREPTKYNFTPAPSDEYLSTQRSDMVTPEAIFKEFQGFGLLEIDVATLRGLGLRVTWEPEEDGEDHVAVWGLKGSVNALRRRLCERENLVRIWEPGTSHVIWPVPEAN